MADPTKSLISQIFEATHPDYRGRGPNGEHGVLRNTERGTAIVYLETLTLEELRGMARGR